MVNIDGFQIQLGLQMVTAKSVAHVPDASKASFELNVFCENAPKYALFLREKMNDETLKNCLHHFLPTFIGPIPGLNPLNGRFNAAAVHGFNNQVIKQSYQTVAQTAIKYHLSLQDYKPQPLPHQVEQAIQSLASKLSNSMRHYPVSAENPRWFTVGIVEESIPLEYSTHKDYCAKLLREFCRQHFSFTMPPSITSIDEMRQVIALANPNVNTNRVESASALFVEFSHAVRSLRFVPWDPTQWTFDEYLCSARTRAKYLGLKFDDASLSYLLWPVLYHLDVYMLAWEDCYVKGTLLYHPDTNDKQLLSLEKFSQFLASNPSLDNYPRSPHVASTFLHPVSKKSELSHSKSQPFASHSTLFKKNQETLALLSTANNQHKQSSGSAGSASSTQRSRHYSNHKEHEKKKKSSNHSQSSASDKAAATAASHLSPSTL